MDKIILNRFVHIDLLESIAILFVVTYHSIFFQADFINNPSLISYFGYYFTTLLSTCVPLFFFANGYLLFSKKFNLKKHINKTLRIIALVLIWAFINIFISTYTSGDKISAGNMLMDFLNWNIKRGIHPLWFLCTLVCIYIIFPALKSLFDTNKKAFIFFTSICLLMTVGMWILTETVYSAGIALHNWFGEPKYYKGLLRLNPFSGMEHQGFAIGFFCIGGLCFFYEEKILNIPKFKRNIICILGIVISCTMLMLVGIFNTKYIVGQIWDVVYDGYNSVFTLINVFFIYVLCLNYKSKNGLIKNISSNTLGIYLLHGFVIGLTKPIILSIKNIQIIPVNILYAVLISLGCLLISLIIKKIPIIKHLL